MSPLPTPRMPLARRILVCGGALILTIGLGTYMLFQARFLIEGPRITLTEKPAILQDEQKIVLSGTAENIVAITINGRPMVTDETGAFSVPIILSTGYTVVQFSARDRFGRTTTYTESFVYTPKGDTVTYQTDAAATLPVTTD